MKRTTLRAAQGLLLACGAPLGWLLLQWLGGGDPAADLREQPGVYVYMLVGTMAVFAAFGAYVGHNEQYYRESALHDPLTGLYNLRHFRQLLRRALSAAGRRGAPVSVISLDLDHFKRVNDQYGHAAGDEVLTAVARALEREQRSGDTVARVGGEEFAVVLPFADAAEAKAAAERLRKAVAEIEFAPAGSAPFRVTASFGVATAPPRTPEPAAGLMRRADKAMYAAKAQGRNRTVSAGT